MGRISRLRIEAREQHHHGARLRPVGWAGNRGSLLPVDDVVRRIEEGVDPSPPWISSPIGEQWKLELEWLPVRAEDHVKEHSFRREPRRDLRRRQRESRHLGDGDVRRDRQGVRIGDEVDEGGTAVAERFCEACPHVSRLLDADRVDARSPATVEKRARTSVCLRTCERNFAFV